jgi:hypothetical protein
MEHLLNSSIGIGMSCLENIFIIRTMLSYGPPEIPKTGVQLVNYRPVYRVDVDGDVFVFLEMFGYK